MDATQPSLDAVFDLLADRRRRYVLYYLSEVGERAEAEEVEAEKAEAEETRPEGAEAEEAEAEETEDAKGEGTVLAVADVADRVAAWEREWDAAERSEGPNRREAIRVELHHDHLPRLADAGLVDYDARTKTIRARAAPTVERWVSESDELPRLRALLGVGPPDEASR